METRRFGQDAYVGRGSQDCARAGGYPIDRGDHRLRHLAQVAHAGAGHAGELVDVARSALQQLGNDLVDVPARTKPAAPTAQDEHLDVIAMAKRIREVADIRVDLERQSIEALGSGEGEGRDPVLLLVVEVLPMPQGRRTATASISTSASGSNRERTSISVDAG